MVLTAEQMRIVEARSVELGLSWLRLMENAGSAAARIIRDNYKLEGQKVVIVDDLIATGGTIEAITKLVEELGGEVVKIVFLMELEGLNGREKLQGYNVDSVIKYPGK